MMKDLALVALGAGLALAVTPAVPIASEYLLYDILHAVQELSFSLIEIRDAVSLMSTYGVECS